MKRAAAISFFLVVVVLAIFGQTRSFDFVNYDDPGHVSDQPGLRAGMSTEGLRWAFGSTLVGNYIPLTALSFLADYDLHGLAPGGYHLTNTLIHAASAVLLFLFLRRATGALWPSALVAALFAVHPLRVESVAWISSRKDVLCGLFWMLTLHAHVSYVRRPGIARYALVLLGVCAALASKPMAVTLPFVLLLLDFWPLARTRGPRPVSPARIVLEKLPLLAPVIAMSAATLAIQRASGAVAGTEILPWSWRAANATVSYAAYLGQTVWPAKLVPLYPFPEHGVPGAQVAIAGAILSAITVAVLFLARRAPWAAVGWFWYLGALVPVIGLVQVGAQSRADRYTYLPQIGLFVFVAWTLSAVAARSPRAARAGIAVACLAAIAVFAALAQRQTGHWRSSVSLWSHTVAITPDSFIARSSYGEALMRRGDLEAARRELEASIRLRPTHRATRLNMAQVAIRQGRLDDAFLYCRAMTIEWPEDPDANTAWASALIRYGLYELALDRLAIALTTDPEHVEALSNRGAALMLLGRVAEAVEPLRRALELAPEDPVILTNLGAAYEALGDREEARRLCESAVRADPAYEPALALRRKLAAGARKE